MDLRETLFQHQDLSYRAFTKKLLPTIDESKIIGVRMPVMHKLSQFDFAENKCEYYEEVMMKGLLLARKDCSVQEHIDDLKEFVPLIDNWSVCDIVCASLKFTAQYRDALFPFIKSCLGKSEFETRFGMVMLRQYYLTENYIDEVLAICTQISGEYYVNMAVAWTLADAFVKFKEKTLSLLQTRRLLPDIQNKTIQKIKDSYRIAPEDKAYINQLKSARDSLQT